MKLLRPTHPYVPISHGFLYLVAVIDWASRAVLSVEIVVFACLRRSCLEDRNPRSLHKAQGPCAVAAGQIYSDALQIAEGRYPGEHLPIALAGRVEVSRSHDPILLIDNGCDVQILVRIDAADDSSLSSTTAIPSLRH